MGWSAGALRLLRLHGIKPSDTGILPLRYSVVSVDDILKHIASLPRGTLRGPSVLPLFSVKNAREYQWTALMQMFRKSGFLVAPCGAGKTLMGLMTAACNGGRFLVLTTRYAEQWKQTLDDFFTSNGTTRVAVLGADDISISTCPDVVIATYSGLAARSLGSHARIVRILPYETVILDEAHTAASPSSLSIVDDLFCKYMIALTATKVREDNELEKLENRIGGTLASIDRTRLVQAGYVSDVKCLNLIVPYTGELESRLGRTVSLALDANKAQVLCSTLRQLGIEGHKTIVFCDDLFCLEWSKRLVTAFGISVIGSVSMKTHASERDRVIEEFRGAAASAVLFVSRTGDEALDIPSASAGVVFWNHWASRRQIVQRLGRIARVSTGGPSPVFVILLADDEVELEKASHREAYMHEHGFVLESLPQHKSHYGTYCRPGTSGYVERVCAEWQRRGRT